jgi:uncharacterized protein
MRNEIQIQLNLIESVENVRIVYACESGSRAWGFPSKDSDYDVRFLFLRPTEKYLSIEEKRDVIERPIDGQLDINGWDLRKALRLFAKSNPPLMEWLGSPIVYLEGYLVADRMRELAPIYYSTVSCMYHYYHMARGNYREYLKGAEVWTKKYFYVLRPLLAIRWIEQSLGVVPTDFNSLVDTLVTEPVLRREIYTLLEAKKGGAELDSGSRIEPISDFIENELARFDGCELERKKESVSTEALDDLFRTSLHEVWHNESRQNFTK